MRRSFFGGRLPTGKAAGRGVGASGVPDVVLRSPQNLIPSSMSTTSLGSKGPPAALASKK